LAAGVAADRLILDPGIGFGKAPGDNWALIAQAARLADLGFPVLWGVSRKRFLAGVYPGPTDPWQRDQASVSLTTWLAAHGAWGVRTHTVTDHRVAIAVAQAIRDQVVT
jgi:dihydropteroate synthase